MERPAASQVGRLHRGAGLGVGDGGGPLEGKKRKRRGGERSRRRCARAAYCHLNALDLRQGRVGGAAAGSATPARAHPAEWPFFLAMWEHERWTGKRHAVLQCAAHAKMHVAGKAL